MELFVFIVAGACCLAGALGVVLSANPVHAALSLVGTLFGIAVLFVAQEANFLAAVQVIVYAGAIVVLFLFVLMLLGVDRSEDLTIEPIGGQRIAALVNERMENIGARRLHTVMTTLLEDVLFELPDRGTDTITVDATVVKDRLKAIVEDEDLRKYIL